MTFILDERIGKKKFISEIFIFGLAVVWGGCISLAQGQESEKKAPAKKSAAAAGAKGSMPEPFIGTPDKIKWVQFAPGIEYGPVHGNCDKPGAPCVFQLRFAAGGKFPRTGIRWTKM